MAHDMVGKNSGITDLTGVSGLLIRSGGSSNPFARVAAHSNSGRPAQFSSQSAVSNHEIRTACLAIVIGLHLGIVATSHF
jgi:hypothetical protein